MFIGRIKELQQLRKLKRKKAASLVVVKGRRRIGKSSLVEQFGKDFDAFYEFQGLAPRSDVSNKDQLENFAEKLKHYFSIPKVGIQNWTDSFSLLAKLSEEGETLILLDEISWMASGDINFLGKLKIAWDTQFKRNKKLIMVLCGSVSSWIDHNILKDTDFLGRISLEVDLQELLLNECSLFWGKNTHRISPIDKLKVLSVTGGVPRYLEEIDPNDSAESNITRLCFDSSNILFNEFDKIFNDIFSNRASIYKEILQQLKEHKLSAKQTARRLGQQQNGDLSEYLADMVKAGFLSRDYAWKLDGTLSKLSQYRIKDNYLRFYLKYIEPNRDKIASGIFHLRSLDSLLNWDTIAGLQFENLVIHNRRMIINALGIEADQLIQAAPYFQTKTKVRSGCQIDLLILCKYNSLYLCEIKFKKNIGSEIIDEVEQKIKRFKCSKNTSIRPVLIFAGSLSESVKNSNYFANIIDLGELF